MPKAISVVIAILVAAMNGLVPTRIDANPNRERELAAQVESTPAEMSVPDDDHAVAFREAHGSLKDMPSPRPLAGLMTGLIPPSPPIAAFDDSAMRVPTPSRLSGLNPRAP